MESVPPGVTSFLTAKGCVELYDEYKAAVVAKADEGFFGWSSSAALQVTKDFKPKFKAKDVDLYYCMSFVRAALVRAPGGRPVRRARLLALRPPLAHFPTAGLRRTPPTAQNNVHMGHTTLQRYHYFVVVAAPSARDGAWTPPELYYEGKEGFAGGSCVCARKPEPNQQDSAFFFNEVD